MTDCPKLSPRKRNLILSKLATKSMIIAILIAYLICGLSACASKTSGKTEKQISSDIQEQDDYFNTYNLKVDSFSVSKRQTNLEDKNDFVWCEVTASNDLFSYSAQYKLTYVLYNEGWLLEEYNQEGSSVVPIAAPTQTQDDAMALVLADWEQSDKSNVSESHIIAKSSLQKESDLTYAYYFRMAWKNRHGLDGIDVDYAVYYHFDLTAGWSTEVTTGVQIDWKKISVANETAASSENSAVVTDSEISTSVDGVMNQVKAVCAGDDVTAVIDSESVLWMWGNNTNGQLGISSSSMQLSDIPIKVMQDVKDVSIGLSHVAAIKTDGTLWMWGSNSSGQLGNGSEGGGSYEPVKVMDQVASVSLGPHHTAAIKTDGTLWMWGQNSSGQLGNGHDQIGNIYDSNVPVKILDDVVTVSAGFSHVAAIKTDYSLWVWGSNNQGELGDPYIGSNRGLGKCQDVPVQIMDNIADVSVGGEFTSVLKVDGSLWTWGQNDSGQLGTGNGESKIYTPTEIMDNVVSICAGTSTMSAIKNDGSLWMWGSNRGRFGNGMVDASRVPVKVMDTVATVDLGAGHTIVTKKDGSFWLWGNSDHGQLGNGMTSAYIDTLDGSYTQDDFVDLGNGLWIGPPNRGSRGPYQTTPIQIQLK